VFDHVTIRVSDMAASEAFYSTVLGALGVEPLHNDEDLVEWENDFSIAPADAEHPVTRGLHVAWFAIAPHVRVRLGDDTPERARFRFEDGSFSLIDGNNVEAVNHNR
jgi:catechol 2,3-dioxygenase-like lactoylglutathione lyase family enzyme